VRSNNGRNDGALKLRKENNHEDIAQFLLEGHLHRNLRHPHIISIKFVFAQGGLLTEYAEYGNLRSFIRSHNVNEYRVKFSKEIASGMNYLHSQNPPILHQDMKCSNILITSVNGEPIAKIGDFGMSRVSGFEKVEALRTPSYQKIISPERISFQDIQNPQFNSMYTKSSDVYGYSFILWEMLQTRPLDEAFFLPPSGIEIVKPPINISYLLTLDGRDIDCSDEIAKFLFEVKQGYRPWLPENCSCPDYISLISMCWMTNPEDRPTFQEIESFLLPLKEFHFITDLPNQQNDSTYLNEQYRR